MLDLIWRLRIIDVEPLSNFNMNYVAEPTPSKHQPQIHYDTKTNLGTGQV